MSNRNNDVFKVLIPTVADTILTNSAKTVEDLGIGELGIFEAHTSKSINAANVGKNDFRIIVAEDTNGDSVVDKLEKQAGQYIQVKNLKSISLQGYRNPKPQIEILNPQVTTVGTTDGIYDEEYGIKINFLNPKITRLGGKHEFSKYYNFTGGLVQKCANAYSVHAKRIAVMQELVTLINDDPDGLVTAELVTIDGFFGEEVYTAITIDDICTYLADNTDSNLLRIRLTTVPMAIKDFIGINVGYYKDRETTIQVFYKESFLTTSTITTLRPVQYEQGSGYDVFEREYQSEGWETSSYRTNTVTGLPRDRKLYADTATKYNLISLEYTFDSDAGWNTYNHNLATEIAVPVTLDDAWASLIALFNTHVKANVPHVIVINDSVAEVPGTIADPGVITTDEESLDPASIDSVAPADKDINEAVADDGSITETLVINIVGGEFAADIDADDITETNKITGLTLVATRTDKDTLTLSWTGNAAAHLAANSITNYAISIPAAKITGADTALTVTGIKFTFTGS